MNIPAEYIPFLSVIAGVAATLITNWWAQKNLASRVPYQNDKDKVDALKTALELAGMDIAEQLELKKKMNKMEAEYKEFREAYINSQYRITHVMLVSMTEKPYVESVSIESVRIPKQDIPVAQ